MNQLKWSKLNATSKDELLKQYEAKQDLTSSADTLNMPLPTLKRRIREYREFTKLIIGTPGQLERKLDKTDNYPTILPGFKMPQLKLTDIKTASIHEDQQEWIDAIVELQAVKGNVTVMHGCDIHYPFADASALEVWYQLVEHTQPDIVVVGSDSADFALLSTKFKRPADMDENTSDELEMFDMFWRGHIRRIKQLAPNAVIIFIYGNHEYRLLRFLNDAAPKLRHTVMKAFKDIIRCDGAVLYIGDTDYIRLGPIVIQHGKRFNQYPVKASLADLGNQLWTQFGHIHRLDECVIVGELYTVGGWASGKLCQNPHYIMGKVMKHEQLGTTIMDVDLRGREVKGDNLLFFKDEDSGIVSVRFERKIFIGEI